MGAQHQRRGVHVPQLPKHLPTQQGVRLHPGRYRLDHRHRPLHCGSHAFRKADTLFPAALSGSPPSLNFFSQTDIVLYNSVWFPPHRDRRATSLTFFQRAIQSFLHPADRIEHKRIDVLYLPQIGKLNFLIVFCTLDKSPFKGSQNAI